jgi:hypothetical protein
MIKLNRAKALKVGTILHHAVKDDEYGNPRTATVIDAPVTWSHNPSLSPLAACLTSLLQGAVK